MNCKLAVKKSFVHLRISRIKTEVGFYLKRDVDCHRKRGFSCSFKIQAKGKSRNVIKTKIESENDFSQDRSCGSSSQLFRNLQKENPRLRNVNPCVFLHCYKILYQ